jgi:Mn2+/Fe2+ NRAMP family transporter
MVLPLLVLVPVLYVTQETTVRLGIVTGKGHGAPIRERFGRGWALVSAGTLFGSAIGALLTELAGVGALFGVPPVVSVPLATVFLRSLVLTGSYRRVERIPIAVGLAELLFVVAMVLSHPSAGAAVDALGSVPLRQGSYLLLVAADVGLGHPGTSLRTVGQIAEVLTGSIGRLGGTVLFGLGMLGAALVAASVSSLTGAGSVAHLPVKRGSRLSTNARAASTWSRVRPVWTWWVTSRSMHSPSSPFTARLRFSFM